MKTIQQLSVFLENKKGRLTQVTNILNQNGIDITAFSVADASEYGILRMIVNNTDLAYEALKAANLMVKKTDVLAIVIPHKQGSLHKILEILTEGKVQIEYMYAFAFRDSATAVIRSSDMLKTASILEANKQQLLEAKDIYE